MRHYPTTHFMYELDRDFTHNQPVCTFLKQSKRLVPITVKQ